MVHCRFLHVVMVGVMGWGSMMAQGEVKAPPLPKGDAARLEARVRMLVRRFHPRDFTHPEKLDLAALWIGAQFRDAGAEVLFQNFSVEGRSYQNVLALIGPSNGPRIVMGGHYDAFRTAPGADDNASGVAVLMELAHLVRGLQLPCTLELVAFANEEPPSFRTTAMGSFHHAALLARQKTNVLAMVSVDMVGDFQEGRSPQGPFAKVGKNTLAVVASMNHADLAARVKRAMSPHFPGGVELVLGDPRDRGIDWSDHRNYWEKGFPAVFLTDAAWERTNAYHTSGDVPERLDYQAMAKIAEGLRTLVMALGKE